MNVLKVLLVFLVLILCNCYSYLWVSDLDYVEPVYGIKETQIVKTEIVKNASGDLYKIKYRVWR